MKAYRLSCDLDSNLAINRVSLPFQGPFIGLLVFGEIAFPSSSCFKAVKSVDILKGIGESPVISISFPFFVTVVSFCSSIC